MHSFIKEYKSTLEYGVTNKYTPIQIANEIYTKEFNNCLRYGIKPRISEIKTVTEFLLKSSQLPIFDFISEVNKGKSLFLGEGNFSFSLSVAKQISYPNNIIATCFEKDSIESASTNIDELLNLGVQIFKEVDATKISKLFSRYFVDNIIFNFSHTGSREPIDGRNPNFILLRDFLISSKTILAKNGKVIISIVDSPHYRGAFQFEEAVKSSGYSNYEIYSFNPLIFPEYEHIMTNIEDSAISKDDSLITIVFTL